MKHKIQFRYNPDLGTHEYSPYWDEPLYLWIIERDYAPREWVAKLLILQDPEPDTGDRYYKTISLGRFDELNKAKNFVRLIENAGRSRTHKTAGYTKGFPREHYYCYVKVE